MRTRVNIGSLRWRVTLQNPGDPVADSDGAPSLRWPPDGGTTLASRVYAAVTPAVGRMLRTLQGLVAATSEATATHIVTIRYLAGVTTQTRVVFHDGTRDRLLYVTGVFDEEEQHVALRLLCNEAVQ